MGQPFDRVGLYDRRDKGEQKGSSGANLTREQKGNKAMRPVDRKATMLTKVT
jgi:hypothetical protein